MFGPSAFTASRVSSVSPFKLPQSVIARRPLVVRAKPDSAASSKAIEVNDKNFKEMVLENPLPVIVDFWAPWCGPCRMIAPLIDEIAEELEGKVVAVKLNTDESPGTATDYGIRSIPTVMVFKGGKKLETVIGAVPKDTLLKTINKFVD